MVFIAFWIMNMDSGLGFYSDLNLWYAFALAILYRYAVEQKPHLAVASAPSSRSRLRPVYMTPIGARH
jgi:hypothetical protein